MTQPGPDGERWEHYVVLANADTFAIPSSEASGEVRCSTAETTGEAKRQSRSKTALE